MACIDVHSLEKLFKYIGTTACGETQDFVGAAITNSWTKEVAKNKRCKDYFNPAWNTISFATDGDDHMYYICHMISATTKSIVDGKDLNPDLKFTPTEIMNLINTGIDKYGHVSLSIDFDHDHALCLIKTEF